ncbi:MAG: hypothetical protein ACREAB_03005 [Blastocatellia bacterium]
MESDRKAVAGFIALCGFTLAALARAAFAQQPTPTAAPDAGAGSAAACRQPASSDVSERERVLLERIERMERRLGELESRSGATPTTMGSAATTTPPAGLSNAAPTNVVAQQNPAPPAAATTSQRPNHAAHTIRKAPPPSAAWDKDGVKIIPYGILIANVNYNTSALVPGSWSAFATPDVLPDTDQFNVSPGNTYLGVDVKWPKIGQWEINGKVDFNLRGTLPLTANNIFQLQFVHIYGEARTERYRVLAGQTEDVVAPLIPNTLNQYPITFIPGSLGYFRPQVRFETFQPVSDNFTLIFQGAVAQAIQTFDVGEGVIGRQTGAPDGQVRVALGYGKPAPNDPLQKRPFELGLSGHIGERRGTLLTIPAIERDFTSWSGTVDLSFKIGGKVRFEGEFFSGSVLGDYAGGVFQTFNPDRGVAIRAAGAWAQLTYDINDQWQVNGGYGRDDPYNRDLSFGRRSLNEMGFGNVFYRITPRLWVALELAHWRTRWVGLPTGSAFRVEPAVLFFF